MPDAHFEIPALPVLAPVAMVLMVASWLALRRREVLTGPRLTTAWAGCLWLVGVLAVTLLPLQVALGRYANQVAWYEKGNIIPLLTIDLPTFVLNVVMTFPLGFLLPLLTRIRNTAQVAVIGLAFSAAIEVVQWATGVVLSSGRTADVNDLAANTLGAVVGYLAWRRISAIDGIDRLVAHYTLPARQPVR